MRSLQVLPTYLLVILSLTIFTKHVSTSRQRPLYIMGHLVNSIKEIPEYLERGSNVLESDVKFFKNGSVKAVHHGFPCDCGRECENSANLANYLQTVRNITDPNTPGNYYNQLVMQFFDLKLNTSEDKRYSGREIARHVLDYLWGEAGEREQEVKNLLYICSTFP
ncbi:UNVERIFIED_CONTAM: Phospholipase D LiSicTox-alphaIA1bi [Trichonephila clavipes]